MKTVSRISLRNAVLTALFTCLLVAGSVAAFAVPPNQVHLSKTPVQIQGQCCQDVAGESVQVSEPAETVPVIVTWSVQYTSNGPFDFGIRVNGGGCGDFGPTFMPTSSATGLPVTYQHVIFPNAGLLKGINTLQICVGSAQDNDNTLVLGERTLAVQFSK
jgi:hypothetical protein